MKDIEKTAVQIYEPKVQFMVKVWEDRNDVKSAFLSLETKLSSEQINRLLKISRVG